MGLEFGIFDHMDRSDLPLARFYEDRLTIVEAYDRLGFYGYHVAEHHATPLGMSPSPSVYLSAVSQRTRRLRFGPMVYTISLYHPLRLAEEICMLDQLSGGRFQVGVGKGISPIEIGYYGVEPEHASAIYNETLAVILKALTRKTLDHEGEFHRFRDVPIALSPLQTPHPPFWFGAGRPDSAERAARQGGNIISNAPSVVARKLIAAYRAEQDRMPPAPAEPRLGINRFIFVAETDEKALASARRAYRLWWSRFMTLWLKHDIPPVGVVYPTEIDGQIADGRAVVGSPDTVRRALEGHLAETGANYLMGRFVFGDLSLDEALGSIELFARHVMPDLRRTYDAAA